MQVVPPVVPPETPPEETVRGIGDNRPPPQFRTERGEVDRGRGSRDYSPSSGPGPYPMQGLS